MARQDNPTDPDVETKEKETTGFSIRDAIAMELIKLFIKEGYPAIDPVKQVDAAYVYADLCVRRRES